MRRFKKELRQNLVCTNTSNLQLYNVLRKCSVRIRISYSWAAVAGGAEAEGVGEFFLFLSANWRC